MVNFSKQKSTSFSLLKMFQKKNWDSSLFLNTYPLFSNISVVRRNKRWKLQLDLTPGGAFTSFGPIHKLWSKKKWNNIVKLVKNFLGFASSDLLPETYYHFTYSRSVSVNKDKPKNHALSRDGWNLRSKPIFI